MASVVYGDSAATNSSIIYEKSCALTDNAMFYCPGCSHGIVHKLVAESLAELEVYQKSIVVTAVGCSVLAYNYFNFDGLQAAHGRATAVATGVKRTNPDKIVFTYQGDGDLAAIGTGGTITGCAHKLRKSYPSIRIATAEPENSAILSGGIISGHGQQGIGDGFIPVILDTECFDDVIIVSDKDAFNMARRLAREEGIFCGISSGTNVWAAIEFAKKLPKGSNIVTICVDLGDRYLSVDGFIV